MFLQYRGKSDLPAGRKTFQIHSRNKTAKGWLRVENGLTALHLVVESRREAEFVEPGLYDGVGELALLAESLPALNVATGRVSITAVPADWINVADAVLPFLGRLGFNARIAGRTLEVECPIPTERLLRSLGVALLALDSNTRGTVSQCVLEEAQRSALRLFEERSDELVELLDSEIGAWRLRQLLKSGPALSKNTEQENEIKKALKQLQVTDLVHFHCGTGRLLRELNRVLSLRTAVGIEPSLIRANAGALRDSAVKILHGSVTEPPPELLAGSTALLVDSLPRLDSPSRIDRASEVLFGAAGFGWVLCIEDERWPREELLLWAQSVVQRFGYRTKHWLIRGTGTAVLFRRGGKAPEASTPPAPHSGRGQIETKLRKRVLPTEEQWKSTVEAFSLRTVDPRWLFYLPPGLSSLQADRADEVLEHPADAFEYYRAEKIPSVVVELKHMGSRAIVIVCRDEQTALKRFGQAALGCVYTRNGRPFFDDPASFLTSLRDGLSKARFWERFKTQWVCLDGELMPWTLKAERLIDDTHGSTVQAGEAMFTEMSRHLSQCAPEAIERIQLRRDSLQKYARVLAHYKAAGEAEPSFAPFHLIATEGKAYFAKNHVWHMTTLGGLVRAAAPPFVVTPYRHVRLDCQAAISDCLSWWEELCGAGHEGVVVKPIYFLPRGRRGLAQPGIKCRSKEHLRLVYGPEYDMPENRVRLLDRPALARRRAKHRRVLQQLALSVEGVERFVRGEDLSRIDECVRAILALECKRHEPAETLNV